MSPLVSVSSCYSFACLLKFIMPFQRKGKRKSVLGILVSSKSEADFKIPCISVAKVAEDKGEITNQST